jgi:TPR repeat protein
LKAGNNANALDGLGFAYETGQGKMKDPAKAFSLYQQAASVEGGYDLAEFHLGNCYARGVGIAEDQVKAGEWFKKAAEKGAIPGLWDRDGEGGPAVGGSGKVQLR